VVGTVLRSALLAGLIAAPFACSGSKGGGGGDVDGAGGNGSANASGAATSAATDSGIVIEGGSTVVGVDGEPCVADVATADLVDVDIHIMLDKSGSMNDRLANGDTKWDAVVASLTEFIEDQETADIGIGLQYFPLIREGGSFTCLTNDDCGGGSGPCSSSACVTPSDLQGFTLYGIDFETTDLCGGDDECGSGEVCKAAQGFCTDGGSTYFTDSEGRELVCETDADCAGETCDLFGICEYLDPAGQPVQCLQHAAPCPLGYGDCVAPYVCVNALLCSAADYATPAVEITTDAARSSTIASSLAAQDPYGSTPTGPALSGVIEHARERATANPDRRVVAVLATDGLPTDCEPLEIAEVSSIARDGVTGTPSVSTYVIGVFSDAQADEAQSNLDQIAEAGGTEQAFVVTTDNDVAGTFLAALNEIRGSALTCDFTIPQPPSGQSLDFGQVNLEFVAAGGETRQLVNVSEEGACGDAPDEGWYYVRDDSGTPTQISVCPDVCAEFQTAMGESQVNLQLGCATIIK